MLTYKTSACATGALVLLTANAMVDTATALKLKPTYDGLPLHDASTGRGSPVGDLFTQMYNGAAALSAAASRRASPKGAEQSGPFDDYAFPKDGDDEFGLGKRMTAPSMPSTKENARPIGESAHHAIEMPEPNWPPVVAWETSLNDFMSAVKDDSIEQGNGAKYMMLSNEEIERMYNSLMAAAEQKVCDEAEYRAAEAAARAPGYGPKADRTKTPVPVPEMGAEFA